MPKRQREVDEDGGRRVQPTKRNKTHGKDHFDDLSDELVLRTLSFLPLTDLITIERSCKRLHRLATDNEIWREKFYNQFVRPRARRIPGLKSMADDQRERHALHYASKSAKWLEHATRSGLEKDWKRRYKVKLNWSQGRCRTHEMALDYPVNPRLLVKMCQGIIVTASDRGLRSYSQRVRPQLLSTYYWEQGGTQVPTALTVDVRGEDVLVIVGFSSGCYEAYTFDEKGDFMREFLYSSEKDSGISGLALSWPYLLSMSKNQELNLYEFYRTIVDSDWKTTQLASLHSDAILSPVSLSIRRANNTLIASIVYSFSRLNAGWCLGLQEIRLSLTGDVVGSRLTSTAGTPLRDFPLRTTAKLSSRSATTGPLPLHPQLMYPPNSLSHAGCYILAGLPDNTLMVYTITSGSDKLEINAGRRLWGHTSAVSGAEVSERGKALSISAKGDEIRVWELEDILSSYSLSKTSTELRPWPKSSGIQAALLKRGTGVGLAFSEMKDELPWTRHWVGFDDEQVVVLGERDQRQTLSCYDFA